MNIPENLLEGKNVLIGVTGSIAVYKTLDLVRLFIKAGADVKVVMSDAAKKFVTPLTFEALSRNAILDEASESWSSDHNHIKTGEWADLFIIAPCSANTIAKLAGGIADNMLTQTALAYAGVKLIAPSANTNMINNPITKANVKLLSANNYEVVPTQVKELACQTTGDGAMAEPINIFYHASRLLLKDSYWENRRVVVSGGGTVEKIDDVRYISNFSSGKMASSLATALYLKGADVTLIATRYESDLPLQVHTVDVESSTEMLECLNDAITAAKHKQQNETPYLFMAAAVSDYVPTLPHQGKLKKDRLGESYSLELKQNIDILSSLNKEGVITVGFKAEMDETTAVANAKALIERKGVDAVCLNILKDSNSFGSSDNAIELITKEKSTTFARADKLTLSLQLLKAFNGE